MTSRRPQAWAIEEDRDGGLAVTHGNRPVATGMRNRGHAEDIVRHSRIPGERVWYQEPDGYRTELTRHFPDPAPQSEPPARPTSSRPVRDRYLARYGRPRAPSV